MLRNLCARAQSTYNASKIILLNLQAKRRKYRTFSRPKTFSFYYVTYTSNLYVYKYMNQEIIII